NYIAPANYTVNTGTITAKPLTIAAPTLTASKVYNGSAAATVTAGTLSGVETGDVVSVIASASYADETVGTGKTITVVYTLSGTDAGNYIAPANYTVNTGTITAKPLTIAVPTLTASKVYNGSAAATVTAGTLSGVETGDVVSLIASASYADETVGTGKTITVVYTLSGTDADNYIAPANYTVNTGTITAKPLTIAAPTLTASKVYNGSAAATVTAGTLSGVETGDVVSVIASASYADETVGTGKTITVVYTLSGTDAGNYIAPANYTVNTGTITAKPLTIAVPTLTASKVYNGSAAATVTAGTLSGVETGDVVSVIASASYVDETVGTGKTITVVYTLSGTDAGNYIAPANYTVNTGTITAKPLTIAAPTLTASKVYNGSAAATVTAGTLSGVETGDVVSVIASASYADETVGTGKTITVVYTLSGTDAGNYIAPANYTVNTGEISVKTLTIGGSFAALNKVYDGVRVASLSNTSLKLNGVVGDDDVTLTALPEFDTKNVGTNKTVLLTGSSLTGDDVLNYILSYTGAPTATANINAKSISVTNAVAQDKVYDETTVAVIVGASLADVVEGDDVGLLNSTTGTFATSDVGTDISVTTAIQLVGDDASNYILQQPQGLKADILPSTQTLSLSAGWNMISIGMTPTGSGKLIDVLKPLIDAGILLKVMDEKGKTIENLGGMGWYESIGNLEFTEGYQIKVSENTSLEVEGTPVELPITIGLVQGWNIISFPALNAQNAMDILDLLINDGYLLKVMDESGNAIENINNTWMNFIGNFKPGKGYKVKVSASCTLTIKESNEKSLIKVNQLLASKDYRTVYQGNGYNHMNIVVTELFESGLKAGEQVGIFDGELCVGAVTIDDNSYLNNLISIPASANDGMTVNKNGFTGGNDYTVRVYRNGGSQIVQFDLVSGNEQFAMGETAILRIKGLSITEAERLTNSFGVKLYPNPFASSLAVEISQVPGRALDVDFYDLHGRKVRTIHYGLSTGKDIIKWDGNNQIGDEVNPGIYYIRVNGIYSGNVIKQ
ncbi:beta strand repeat-containing protein, partial [Acinetobacter sp.]|uniref:beta strand repeat-containing protein n=1 Tax=Acinetobacter sp. TaxID=472 RepID=UPI003D088A74